MYTNIHLLFNKCIDFTIKLTTSTHTYSRKMVSSSQIVDQGLVHSIKLSSVGPGHVTSQDSVFEPDNVDLATKLHYVRVIYYFKKEPFEGLTTLNIKEPMFYWFGEFPETCGRFRRAESGRPYVKCNDCGVRFVEGKCDKTVDEWLEMSDVANLEKLLVSNQCIGPELQFSPVVLLQLTTFKCGGKALGLSWSHVLGDAFSAAEFMNTLRRIMSVDKPALPARLAQTLTKSSISTDPRNNGVESLAIKQVESVGDNWSHVVKVQMEAFSFDVTPTMLSDIKSTLKTNASAFELISATIWQCIAKMRGEDTKVVTICKKDEMDKKNGVLGNTQVVSLVKADFSIAKASLSDVASLIKDRKVDERKKIDVVTGKENGVLDFIMYGANLTFVDLDGAKFYDFVYRGHEPVHVSCRIDGVGEEGAVFVQDEDNNAGGARSVIVILPEDEIVQLKSELRIKGLVA